MAYESKKLTIRPMLSKTNSWLFSQIRKPSDKPSINYVIAMQQYQFMHSYFHDHSLNLKHVQNDYDHNL